MQVAVLTEKVHALEGMKEKVDEILHLAQKTEVRLASMPTFQDLSPLKARVTSLEDSRTTARGAWRGVVVAATSLGALGGLITNLISGWWNPK